MAGRSGNFSFGCVPDTDDERTRELLGNICDRLGKALGRKVEPHRSPSPAALASAVKAERVQIAWVSPVLLLTSPLLADAVPLASTLRQGITSYHGVLFTREDAPYRSTLDLRGARAAWVAPTSAGGYLFPRLALGSYGLDPRILFASETFHGSHGNVARAVLSGSADVGASYAVFENGDPSRPLVRAPFLDIDGGPGRVLFTTSEIPSDLIVASSVMPVDVRSALTLALESLADDRKAREAMSIVLGADAFVRFASASLEPLREQIEYGRELELLPDE